jgi:hypothetical protein
LILSRTCREAGAPVFDPLTQRDHVLQADVVLGEVLVVEAVDATEHRREELPVEAGVGLMSQLTKVIEGVGRW